MNSIAALIPSLTLSPDTQRTVTLLEGLARQQVKVHLYVGAASNERELRETLIRSFGCQAVIPHCGWRVAGAHQLALATTWKAAHAVVGLPGNLKKAYFVQEFEPALYPMGDSYLSAERALQSSELQLISLGRSLAETIRRQFDRQVRVVDYGTDLQVFHPVETGLQKEFAIAALFQADVPQAAPQLVIEALALLRRVLPHLRVYTFGGERPPHGLATEHLGIMAPSALNLLFNRCQLGLSLRTGSPSFVPFAMLAAGLPVIAARTKHNEHDFPAQCVCRPALGPAAIRDALLELLSDEPRRVRMGREALDFAHQRPIQIEHEQFRRYLLDIAREAPLVDIRSRDAQQVTHAITNPPDLAPVELLTVDVWDTLLRRRCHPDEIKLFTAQYLLCTHAGQLRTSFQDVFALFAERVECERRLGTERQNQGFDDEYSIRDVFERWLNSVMLEPLSAQDRKQLAARLADVEFEQEKRCVYADPDIAEFLRKIPARRTVFLSDFYMPAESLAALIAHVGLGQTVAEGISSCDAGLNKRSGRLFQAVQSMAGIDPSRHCHVGDNLFSDYFVPRQGRTEARLYTSPQEAHLCQRFAREFAERDGRKGFAPPELVAMTQRPRPTANQGEAESMFQLGQCCAPLVGSFALYLAQAATRRGLGKLHFFTREGVFFAEVYRELARHDPLGASFPEPILLEVSRLATFAASLRSFDLAEFMRLWNLYSTQSLAAFFTSLDLDPAPIAELLYRCGLGLHDPIRHPWLDPRVTKLFAQDRFVDFLAAHTERKRELLLEYLAGKGVSTNESQIGIVDIGWRGTIQDNLAWILPNTIVHGWYLGLAPVLNVQPPNTTKGAFGPRPGDDAELQRLLGFVSPLEMLCNSNSGTTLRYVRVKGRVEAQLGSDLREEHVFERYTRHFQAGVLSRIGEFAQLVRWRAIGADELRSLALDTMAELVHNPPAVAARAYFSLNHNETFGVGEFDDKQRHQTKLHAMRSLYEAGELEQFEQQLVETTWPQGFVVLCGIQYPYFRIAPVEPQPVSLEDKRSARQLEYQARDLYHRKDYSAARTAALRSLALNPWRPKVHYLAFRVCLAMKQTKLAMHHYRLLRKLTTKHAPSLNEFACGTYDVDVDNSAKLFEILVEDAPQYRPGILNLARLNLLQGRFSKALALLDEHAARFATDEEYQQFHVLASMIAARSMLNAVAASLKNPANVRWAQAREIQQCKALLPEMTAAGSSNVVQATALKSLLRLRSDDAYLEPIGGRNGSNSKSACNREPNFSVEPAAAGGADVCAATVGS